MFLGPQKLFNFAIIPLFWLRNSFGFLALFVKVIGRGDIVSPSKKCKTFPKLEKRLKKSKEFYCFMQLH